MLNVYKYHAEPESLHDYENRWKIDPMYAVDVLIQHPDRKDVERVVLSNSFAVLKYVKATAKPFPAGLQTLIALRFNILPLISYAEAINQRVPEIEQELLSGGLNLVDYAERVIKGIWKEAEPIIARDKSTRREYIQKLLGGDWSKFDRGQFGPENDWVDMVSSAINATIDDLNDNGWATADEDEDNEEYDEVVIVCKKTASNSMSIYRIRSGRRTKIGEVVAVSSHEAECKDANGKLACKISIAGTDDDVRDELYDYIYYTLLAA